MDVVLNITTLVVLDYITSTPIHEDYTYPCYSCCPASPDELGSPLVYISLLNKHLMSLLISIRVLLTIVIVIGVAYSITTNMWSSFSCVDVIYFSID